MQQCLCGCVYDEILAGGATVEAIQEWLAVNPDAPPPGDADPDAVWDACISETLDGGATETTP